MDSICITCKDPIVLHETKEVWVDENGLNSCAPHAPRHEPIDDHVTLTAWLPDGTLAQWFVDNEWWEKDLKPLFGPPDNEGRLP